MIRSRRKFKRPNFGGFVFLGLNSLTFIDFFFRFIDVFLSGQCRIEVDGPTKFVQIHGDMVLEMRDITGHEGDFEGLD